jgi:hypothetical protein
MTGAELQAALDAIGWSRRELARRLRRTPPHIDAWVWGKRGVPDWAAAYVRAVERAVARVPVPAE